MDYKFRQSIAPIKKVESIQFGILSPEYIENVSVTQKSMDISGKEIPPGIFDQNNIYDLNTKKPIIGGINDPRMGNVFDLENPGYFGHIKLELPVYHYSFIGTILNILKCVSCYNSKLIISENDLNSILKNFRRKKRIREIVKISQKIKNCPYTKNPLPNYSRDGLKLIVEFKDVKRTISTTEVYSIFEKISNDTISSLGFNPIFCRPEWLLIKVMPIPPPHVRPSVSMSVSQKCEDDLTHKISDILKANIALKNALKNKEKPHIIEQYENLLQYHVSTFFDNKIPGQKPSQQRSGKPLKTIRQRLVGKEGRVRGNLMGKRVDFSARSVITADPNLSMDQVGVPLQIALNLTIPEKVTDYNIEKLQNLVNNGPKIHPGAKYIMYSDAKGLKKIDLEYIKNNIQLKIGYTVERHIDNDDIVLFNRQPSLHKMSIMCHRVKIHKGSTFRLNLSVTTPYNADFDGDEMNLHVPQSQTAIAEAENLMSVQNMIVSPQSNKPVMGIIQDSLLSSYLFTKRDTFIEKDIFMNAIFEFSDEPKVVDICNNPAIMLSERLFKRTTKKDSYISLWTGKQLFSCVLTDACVNFRKTSNGAPDVDDEISYTDTKVNITNGYLLSGKIDKKTIGTSEGSLIHILFNDLGPNCVMKFMNSLQKVANYWILNNSFTIGLNDCIISDYTVVSKILADVKNKVNEINKTDSKTENEINSELNGARDEAGNYVQSVLDSDNNFKSMVLAGSKGNNLNISQVIACLGQQNIEGNRVSNGFIGRTLPHYPVDDIGYESKGFIENSYITSLSPQEFFFHAMAGREGIIDTACKSISRDSELLISIENKTKIVCIGDWIDYNMSIYNYTTEKNTEHDIDILKLKNKVCIPNVDQKGVIRWSIVSHVTRHKNDFLWSIKTKYGKTVNVSKYDTMLICKNKMISPVFTKYVKVGDKVPITYGLVPPSIISQFIYIGQNYTKIVPELGTFLGLTYSSFDGKDILYRSVNKETKILLISYLKSFGIKYRVKFLAMNSLVNIEYRYNIYVNQPNPFKLSRNKLIEFINTEDSFIEQFLNSCIPFDKEIVFRENADILSILCSRIGIFSYNIGKYLHIPKGCLETLNDVVLDEIISIEKFPSEDYVYDLTVPGTLNFSLANGLHIHDTSETGYTQRRVVKSLEDVSVKYDQTVRDSHSNIIQFVYGEDNIDATYIETQEFNILEYSNSEMIKVYKHDDGSFVEEFEQLMKDRETVRSICKYKEPMMSKYNDKYIQIPVNIKRIINNVPKLPGPISKPEEIIEKVKKLITDLNATELFNVHIRSNLASKVLKTSSLDIILDEIKLKYINAQVSPGEMCGIIAAQSMSELTTQLTLNSFHSSGISTKNITLGLPRLKELINVSRKIRSPSLTLFINDEFNHNIEYKTLKDYISKSRYEYFTDSSIKTHSMKIFKEYAKCYNFLDVYLDPKYIVIDISSETLNSTGMTITQLYKKITKDKKIKERFDCIKFLVGNNFLILASTRSDINLRDIEIDFINKVHVNGINGVEKIYLENKTISMPDQETGSFVPKKTKILTTEGSNFSEIFKVDNIDHTKTFSNNINEIYEVLGIEAARTALLNELRLVLSFDGSYINYRHLALLTDIMTYKGTLMSMTRHGINRGESGTLMKCSFEETVEILTEAALYSQKDQINGVSENIMLGQLAPCGTGIVEVLYEK